MVVLAGAVLLFVAIGCNGAPVAKTVIGPSTRQVGDTRRDRPSTGRGESKRNQTNLLDLRLATVT